MQLIILQVIAGIFALFALSRAYLRFKERKLSSFAFIFWIFIWLAGVIAIFFPDLTSSFAQIVGIGRGVDVVLYASIVVIFYLLFRIYIMVEDSRRQVTEVARKVALMDSKSSKSSK